MSLTTGSRLGPYEILAPLGAGGMGEVYRAADTHLKRQVAIKVLPAAVAADAERLARFQREAEVLAALNHPNIAAIYGLQKADPSGGGGQPESIALVMELVEGPTLADRIAQGPVPLADALPIAKQIAEAIEAAHEQGIVHRDLKPANVKVRVDGTVKVLDFGLAKAMDAGTGGTGRAGGTGGLSMSPTLTSPAMMTGAGMILGTAAYMSPEQARGKPVDKRADVWAFGCVLFEMLTGRRAFPGDDVTDTIVAVVSKEPDWHALPADASAVRPLLVRCLTKDPKARMRDIGEARLDLDRLLRGSPQEAAASALPMPRPDVHRRLAPLSIALGLIGGALIAALATWMLMRPAPVQLQQARFAIVPSPAQSVSVSPLMRDLVLSSDGAHLVYVGGAGSQVGGQLAGGQLIVRSIDQLDAVPLPGVSGAFSPFLSPDDRWVGFFTAGDLKKVPIGGGAPTSLCRFAGLPLGASWGPDDTIIFADNDQRAGLFSVPGVGGEPKVLTKPDVSRGEVDHVFPSFLPGGRGVLFTISKGSIESAEVAVLDLKTGQYKTLIRGGTGAQYVEPGYLVYASVGSLRAVRFDPIRMETEGDPVPVVEQVMTKASGVAQFAVSRQGTLVYIPGSGDVTAPPRSLVWVDRQGREEAITAPPRGYMYPRISPDGARVALDIRDQQSDIWILDFARGTLTRLTDSPVLDSYPVWTPDGKRIIFSSSRAGAQNLFWQPADNTGTVQQLTKSPNRQFPTAISPDGTQVVFKEMALQVGGGDVYMVQLPGAPGSDASKARPLVQTTFEDDNGEISPDGRWLAYQSRESGPPEVHVRPFPDTDSGHWAVSTGGGMRPLWARSGRELFYLDATGALMTVPVQTSPTFSAGKPTRVLGRSYYMDGSGRNYDASPDGSRFLMIKQAASAQAAAPASIVVVLNWVEELKAKLPVTK